MYSCVGFPPGGLDQRGGGGGGEVGPQFMMEDLDPLATRSLFVGNIPKHISVYELRDAFLRYGNVLVSMRLVAYLNKVIMYVYKYW